MRLLASRSSVVVNYEPQEGKCDDKMGHIYLLSTTLGTQWNYVNVSHIIAHENKSYALACILALHKLLLATYHSCFNINCCGAQKSESIFHHACGRICMFCLFYICSQAYSLYPSFGIMYCTHSVFRTVPHEATLPLTNCFKHRKMATSFY